MVKRKKGGQGKFVCENYAKKLTTLTKIRV